MMFCIYVRGRINFGVSFIFSVTANGKLIIRKSYIMSLPVNERAKLSTSNAFSILLVGLPPSSKTKTKRDSVYQRFLRGALRIELHGRD